MPHRLPLTWRWMDPLGPTPQGIPAHPPEPTPETDASAAPRLGPWLSVQREMAAPSCARERAWHRDAIELDALRADTRFEEAGARLTHVDHSAGIAAQEVS